jgi:ATP-dependent Zn protease
MNYSSTSSILEVFCRKKKLKDVDLDRVALNTPGYTGADLKLLIKESINSAEERFT